MHLGCYLYKQCMTKLNEEEECTLGSRINVFLLVYLISIQLKCLICKLLSQSNSLKARKLVKRTATQPKDYVESYGTMLTICEMYLPT